MGSNRAEPEKAAQRRVKYVRGLKRADCDIAVLARKITKLACLRLRGIARGDLGTVVGIKMGASRGAVTIGWNGIFVDVVL